MVTDLASPEGAYSNQQFRAIEAAVKKRSSLILSALSLAFLLTATFTPTASATPTLTVGGPNYITATGWYRYTASLSAPYNWFQFSFRFCPSSDIGSCTAQWSPLQVHNDGVNPAFADSHITRDCTGKGTKTHQVRVVAGAFAVGPQTQYKVTLQCFELPN